MSEFADAVRRAASAALNAVPHHAVRHLPMHPDDWRQVFDNPSHRRIVHWREESAEIALKPDPAMVAYIDRMFQAAFAEELVTPEPPTRAPDVALGVLVSSVSTFAYFAEFDRLSTKLIDGNGTCRPLGILGGVDVDTVREHVRRDLVPLVRAAATNPPVPPVPPRPPGPGQPPYPVRSVVDPVTGLVFGRRVALEGQAERLSIFRVEGWGCLTLELTYRRITG